MINYNVMGTDEHLDIYKWSIKRSPLSFFDELKKIKDFNPFEKGWGNGYVKVTNDSPLYRKNPNSLSLSQEITYKSQDMNNNPILGFDCSHSDNTPSNSPKEQVLKWTLELYKEIYPNETHPLYDSIDDICLEFIDNGLDYFRIVTGNRLFIFVDNNMEERVISFKKRIEMISLKNLRFDICNTTDLNFLITTATI